MLSCSERHPVNWSLGISSHLRKKTSKHSAFVDSVSPTVLFISLAITLVFIATVCLLLLLLGPSWPMVPDFRLWVPLAQTAFASSGHAAAKPSYFSFWVVFQIATVVASQSKSMGAWVFHGEFGKALAKPLPGSTPVWSAPVAFIGHLRRLCGMS